MTSANDRQKSLGFNAGRILIVDDFHVMRQFIIRTLESSLEIEIEVVEASDSGEALALFEPSAFALVIADRKMPGLDGLELVRNIRSVDTEVPILMISDQLGAQATLGQLLPDPFS